jgi:hypothetical protein
VPPDDDSDPVLLTRIVAIANGESQNGEIYIRHFVASGENYTRNKQYRDLRFWSEGNADYWSGTSVKYPDKPGGPACRPAHGLWLPRDSETQILLRPGLSPPVVP